MKHIKLREGHPDRRTLKAEVHLVHMVKLVDYDQHALVDAVNKDIEYAVYDPVAFIEMVTSVMDSESTTIQILLVDNNGTVWSEEIGDDLVA